MMARVHQKSFENCARRRILICAQSNADVDELVSRISSPGLYGSNGKMYKPYLVQVGNAKTVHQNSLPFFIDTLVGQRISEDRMPSKDGKNDLRVDSSALLQSNMEKLIDYIRFYETKCANLRAGHPVIMLTEQYRMHPEICKFPSSHFYDNKLLNGSQMSSKSTPCHQTEGLGPYAFYDIVDGREAHEETLVQCRFVMNAKLMLRLKY
ncbi:hypothetical protein KIW84_021687 [Lathyrus oleraceus]|uniref:DNA2/NAM7 helicase-like C-terminal domain-containing protein n=1 Tax=Pisum sativum TaxID=3888 RepID=A0A9D4YD14_PEA|nr:hypothetical protein KIW84_021687 [Pisum sativum]